MLCYADYTYRLEHEQNKNYKVTYLWSMNRSMDRFFVLFFRKIVRKEKHIKDYEENN